MPRTISTEPSTAAVGPTSSLATANWSLWLSLGAFAVLWLDLIRLLSTQWETREQYAYGWFVPFFALGLFIRKWSDRPPPTLTPSPVFLKAAIGLGLLALLPMRVIYEINTDWPLFAWSYSLIVVFVTLFAFYLAGGLPWTRYFFFPVAFILVAVIWPYRIEKGLTQDLMRVVSSITVEILGWFDIPALQKGNVIELANGSVGVSEACSGIRSFQTSLMGALLLGELYRFNFWRRFLLVGSGVGLGFCFNVARTTLLSWQANAHGGEALEKWHDPAGLTIAVACFVCLWALALFLSKMNKSRLAAGLERSSDVSPSATASAVSSAVSPPYAGAARAFLLGVGLWAMLLVAATESWYRSHEIHAAGVFLWNPSFPTNSPSFRTVELSPRTIQLMDSDTYATGSWSDSNGVQWSGYFFRWNPTSIASVLRARIHRPERCLPAAGLSLVADGGSGLFEATGLKLPFRQYTYQAEGKSLHVFFCQWEDGNERQSGAWSSKLADRIRSVLVGRRKLGQQTLELILSGPQTLQEAVVAVQKQLPGLITVQSTLRTARASL